MELDVGEAEAKVIASKARNELAEIEKADVITAKVLGGAAVTTEEYRYIVLFNLRALTQIMWEISNKLSSRSDGSLHHPTMPSLGQKSTEPHKP